MLWNKLGGEMQWQTIGVDIFNDRVFSFGPQIPLVFAEGGIRLLNGSLCKT